LSGVALRCSWRKASRRSANPAGTVKPMLFPHPNSRRAAPMTLSSR
jgi:hypothetical protein